MNRERERERERERDGDARTGDVCACVYVMYAQAAPTLAARCAVREAPAATGISIVGDGRWNGEESLAPRWAPRFRREDLAALPAALLAVIELHDVEAVSFGEALVFAAQCVRLQRLTLERLGDGTDGRSRLHGADLELLLQACLHITSVRIVGAVGHDLDMWSCDTTSTLGSVGLRSLSIVDCDARYDSVKRGQADEDEGAADWIDTNDNLICKVAQGIPSLEQLDLAGTGCPSNHGVRLIESFLPYLQVREYVLVQEHILLSQ
jgi:hypothetical protein